MWANRAVSAPYVASFPQPCARRSVTGCHEELGHDWASTAHGPVPEFEKGVGAWLDERTEAQCCDYGHLSFPLSLFPLFRHQQESV